MYCIEKLCFLSQILCFVLKNEEWGFLKTLSEKFVLLMYYIEKWGFWSQFFCFFIEKWEFLRSLFRKMLHSYVLYWKMMFLKSNLMFCIEKWGMRISKNSFPKKVTFLCIILKNEVFEVNSFVLYWKMRISKVFCEKDSILMYYSEKFFCFFRFLKTILLFCIEKWEMRIS